MSSSGKWKTLQRLSPTLARRSTIARGNVCGSLMWVMLVRGWQMLCRHRYLPCKGPLIIIMFAATALSTCFGRTPAGQPAVPSRSPAAPPPASATSSSRFRPLCHTPTPHALALPHPHHCGHVSCTRWRVPPTPARHVSPPAPPHAERAQALRAPTAPAP